MGQIKNTFNTLNRMTCKIVITLLCLVLATVSVMMVVQFFTNDSLSFADLIRFIAGIAFALTLFLPLVFIPTFDPIYKTKFEALAITDPGRLIAFSPFPSSWIAYSRYLRAMIYAGAVIQLYTPKGWSTMSIVQLEMKHDQAFISRVTSLHRVVVLIQLVAFVLAVALAIISFVFPYVIGIFY